MKVFTWNEEKNTKLKNERGISFEMIVWAIENGQLLDVIKHPNSSKYANQVVLYVEYDGYVYTVPCIENSEEVFLKTAYPDRKATKRYLGESHEEIQA